MRRIIAPLALASLCLATSAAAAQALPFHDSGSGTGSGGLTRTYAGTHQGTHLGNGTFTATVVLPGIPFGCVPVTTAATTTTAANGDQVFSHLLPGATTCPSPAGFVTVGRYQITGGTGRFLNASGTGLFNSTDKNGALTFTADGTISFAP